MTSGSGVAVVAGHLCLDIIPALPAVDVSAIVRPGGLTEVGPAALVAGGVVSNTGRALHRLGVSTRLVAKLGDDPLGAITRQILRDESPDLVRHLRVEPGASSSYSIVLSPPGGDRSFLHYGGANNAFGADDVDDSVLDGAGVFHFGYPSIVPRMYAEGGRELEELYRHARSAGATTSLDLAMPDPLGPSGRVDWSRVLARVLPHVDLFLPTAEELAAMLHLSAASVPELAATALRLGARVVALKLGPRGLYLRTAKGGLTGVGEQWQSRELWMPAFAVSRVAGTTGAGDAAVAGFLAAFLRGRSPEDTLRFAAAVGACSVEALDSVSAILGWEQTQARLTAGWPPATHSVDLPDLRKDALGCWHGPGDA